MEIRDNNWHHVITTGKSTTYLDGVINDVTVSVGYWRLGDMAHPDWKFGDVIEDLNTGARAVLVGPSHASPLSGFAYTDNIPFEVNGGWKLVPEPDD